MKHDKSYLRKKFLLQRRKGHSTIKNFNFNSIFKLIRKNFNRKKITIAGYYPANYEVNILNFLKLASKKKYKITLPVIKTRNLMSFKILPIAGDASFRKFFRIKLKRSSKIIVTASKEKYNNLIAYSAVNNFLIKNKIIAPKIFQYNLSKGIIVIEDFGDTTFRKILTKKKINFQFIKNL